MMAAWKVAPALAAGCAAILKPSELASLYVQNYNMIKFAVIFNSLFLSYILNFRTCLELAYVCLEVGLPAGVLNILTGLGPEAGAPLAAHPHVDKVKTFLITFG